MDRRLLGHVLRFEVGQNRALLVEGSLCVFLGSAEIAIVELHQRLALADMLIVADGDAGNESCDVGRDRSYIATDIGIVCRLDETADRSPLIAIRRSRQHSDGYAQSQEV